MRVASLYSGGKDSTLAICKAKETGHEVVCLVTIHPPTDDSLLFHYPNSWVAQYLADAMQIPFVGYPAIGRTKEEEMKALGDAMAHAKSLYQIEGVLHGGISSEYQKKAFEDVCTRQRIATIAPLWNTEPAKHMNELINRGFRVLIVAVAAMGLGKEWLGVVLDNESLARLASLSRKHGFNLAFEGGEAETLVIDCPLYSKRIEIRNSDIRWDGQRGIFEIRDMALIEK